MYWVTQHYLRKPTEYIKHYHVYLLFLTFIQHQVMLIITDAFIAYRPHDRLTQAKYKAEIEHNNKYP